MKAVKLLSEEILECDPITMSPDPNADPVGYIIDYDQIKRLEEIESRIKELEEGIETEKEDLWSIVGDPTLRKRPLWLFNKLQSIYDNLGELLTPEK